MTKPEIKTRLNLAKQVLSAKNLIVITDTRASMMLQIEEPEDVLVISQQRAALVKYRGIVDDQIKDLDKFTRKKVEDKVKAGKKPKKIEVK